MSTLWVPQENKYYEEVTEKIEILKSNIEILKRGLMAEEVAARWKNYQITTLSRMQAILKGNVVKIVSIKEFAFNESARQSMQIDHNKHIAKISDIKINIEALEKEISRLTKYRETLKTVILRFENGKKIEN